MAAISSTWGFWWWRSALLTGRGMPWSKLAATPVGLTDVLAAAVIFLEMSPGNIGRLFL